MSTIDFRNSMHRSLISMPVSGRELKTSWTRHREGYRSLDYYLKRRVHLVYSVHMILALEPFGEVRVKPPDRVASWVTFALNVKQPILVLNSGFDR